MTPEEIDLVFDKFLEEHSEAKWFMDCHGFAREAVQTIVAKLVVPEARATIDWEEIDRLDAFGTFGGRIIPYNGVWKIMLNETNCELWSLKTHAEAEAKFADAIKKSGYSDAENPLVELTRLKALHSPRGETKP